jgi:two-component system, OmpR family, sensor kinase
MSLRLRLTLLYSTLLGGVLLLYGMLVYGLVNVVQIRQVDSILTQSANQIITQLQVNALDQFSPRSITSFQSSETLYLQVWGNDHQLQLSRPPGLQEPLDEVGQRAGQLMFNSTHSADLHLRVLSVPIQTVRGPVGVLQVALNLALLDVTQRTLATVLVTLTILAMLLAGLATWWVNSQALGRLEAVTQVATNITNADDLSRRIQLSGSADDEVGKLILAFNQTLQQLEELFTSQQRFVADVSHELRTPLTVIKGNIGLIRRMGVADEESLASIETEIDRLTRMVIDLLLLAQVESGRLPLDLKPLDLDTVLLEVFKQMSLLVGDRLHLRLVDIDQVQINADRDRIKQVLLNIMGNAIQYTPAGGTVSLALRKVGQQALVTITDTGPGIPAEDLPYIFERFYRGEKSRKRDPETGFGLGLSIAQWIIRNHDGLIEASSMEGKGTTFSITLPLMKEEYPVRVSLQQ